MATLLANVTDIGTGILWSYCGVRSYDASRDYGIANASICVLFNVLVTLMIIIQLALHTRNIRNAIGASPGLGGLYTAVITMLVESSALSAIAYLLYIASDSAHSSSAYLFSQPLGEIQVRADFLFSNVWPYQDII